MNVRLHGRSALLHERVGEQINDTDLTGDYYITGDSRFTVCRQEAIGLSRCELLELL
jgi:hypothetical protein